MWLPGGTESLAQTVAGVEQALAAPAPFPVALPGRRLRFREHRGLRLRLSHRRGTFCRLGRQRAAGQREVETVAAALGGIVGPSRGADPIGGIAGEEQALALGTEGPSVLGRGAAHRDPPDRNRTSGCGLARLAGRVHSLSRWASCTTSSSSAPGPPVPWSRADWSTAAPASSCSRRAAATRTPRSTIPAGSTSSGSPRWTGRTRPCRRRTRTAAGSPGPAAGCSAARAASTRWSGCAARPRTSTRGRTWAPTAGRGTTCDRSTSASSGASPAAPAS